MVEVAGSRDSTDVFIKYASLANQDEDAAGVRKAQIRQ
jgi:hypothetical protein